VELVNTRGDVTFRWDDVVDRLAVEQSHRFRTG
jgi:hypothetical protein